MSKPVTRIPACTIKGCPSPRDPDFHRCWCGQTKIEHHHVESRGMGGSKLKRHVVALCHPHHEAVTLHICYDIVIDLEGTLTYSYMDAKGVTLHTRTLEAGSAAAVRAEEESALAESSDAVNVAAASPASGESSAAEPPVRGAHPSPAGDSRLVPSPSAAPPSVFAEGEGDDQDDIVDSGQETLGQPDPGKAKRDDVAAGLRGNSREGVLAGGLLKYVPGVSASGDFIPGSIDGDTSRLRRPDDIAVSSSFDLSSWRGQGLKLAQMGLVLKESTSAWQFLVGDWFLEGEQFLGEEVYGHIEELGFPGNTLRQYAWVAGTVSPDTRVLELPWSFHRAVAALPAPKQKEWLAKARDENLTTRQFNLVIHGPPKPKVKRWTLEELRTAWAEWPALNRQFEAFLGWLEAK